MNILTIVPTDGFIKIDDSYLSNIDTQYLSWIPDNVHAFQWNGNVNKGEIEFKVDQLSGVKPSNEKVEELGIFSQAITIFEEEIERRVQAEADALAAIEQSVDYWSELRSIRNFKLSESDWTQLTDSPLSEQQNQDWSTYRQLLRNLPENIEDPKPLILDPNHPSWPVSPSFSV